MKYVVVQDKAEARVRILKFTDKEANQPERVGLPYESEVQRFDSFEKADSFAADLEDEMEAEIALQNS